MHGQKNIKLSERMTDFLHNISRPLNVFFLRGFKIEPFHKFLFPNACQLPHPSYPPIFNHPTVWYRIQI